MGRLDGKVAIVTGAGQGMGAAHARRMASEGAKVILTDIDAVGASQIAKEIGQNALFIQHDVASMSDWTRVVAEAEKAFGPVTVLVNNAGILGPIKNIIDLSVEEYMKVVAVNQHSQFYGMKAVVPGMKAAGGGSIINISSIAGLVASVGAPSIAYVGSKFASRGMTKQIAVEFGPDKIRVNSIHPGYIKTPMMEAATDQDGGGVASGLALRRMAEPDEVSKVVVFLASDDASYVTGVEHPVDGGFTAV
ncbi:3-alpha--hydroxysteroid dehydrogenase [Mytilinidion resinicola]|uniref:3-alpha--hydroxysteroid dehydrogenase n=1 Tax=Mytilinidion resinicola TaxID=574789 RepID=A0A6A6Z7B5_9PEZI|nr:3-alpha--hydroxysteroid dehydrogenase [Mytilinidion resinicola]KAF2816992.1 3-alpha--hydroxysteroid dehydrogenase [Mytilinidion resinicola]